MATPGRPAESGTSNRRNHYRVLQVQPDAPLDVIRANYRALLQKLKLHPDLGGDHWTAAQIIAAYHVLSDPSRRAAYDRKLLSTYDIATLSEGRGRSTSPPGQRRRTTSAVDRRSLYRLLHVQPDAPLELIEASYHAIRNRDGAQADALAAAFATLRDPERRAAYDRDLGAGRNDIAQSGSERATADRTRHAAHRAHAYQPIVTRYCRFCKTPHQTISSGANDAACVECQSPLSPGPADDVESTRRSLPRMRRNDVIGFYTFWPGPRRSARLVDLSPVGMSFQSRDTCSVGDVLKIDAPNLQAVGVVARISHAANGMTVGIRFHTVGFRSQSGSFVSARA